MKNNKQPVLFLIESNTILAVFITNEIAPNRIATFNNIGFHSTCSRDYLRKLKFATHNEYKSFFERLKALGYNLNILNNKRKKDRETIRIFLQ